MRKRGNKRRLILVFAVLVLAVLISFGVYFWAEGKITGNAILTSIDYSNEIITDLSNINSSGFNQVRIITYVRYPGELPTWDSEVFISFPNPTEEELANLQSYLEMLNDSGLKYEFVFNIPDSDNMYYTNGITLENYTHFIDAVWPSLWVGQLSRIVFGGDLYLAENENCSVSSASRVISHRKFVDEVFPYLYNKCPECNIGVEVAPSCSNLYDMSILSSEWLLSNLTETLPHFIGFQYYPTTSIAHLYNQSGEINWSLMINDWYNNISQISGAVPFYVDEVGMQVSDLNSNETYFNEEEQADFFNVTLPFLNSKNLLFNIWEYTGASDSGIGQFWLVDEYGNEREAWQVVSNVVSEMGSDTRGIQYKPASSVGWQFINGICSVSLANTSFSSWSNISSCRINNTILQQRNKTQYDVNNCGEIANQTFYEYQEIACDYCTPSLYNTSWSNYKDYTSCYSNNTLVQVRNKTQYDVNNCGEIANQTFYEYQEIACDYCTPSLYNQSTSWSNIQCLATNQMNQTRNLTQTDSNGCYAKTSLASDYVAPTIFKEYRLTESCDFCTPSLYNTTWSNWTNQTSCYSNGSLNQRRNKVQYDLQNCGEIANQTFYDYKVISCVYSNSSSGGSSSGGSGGGGGGGSSNGNSYLIAEGKLKEGYSAKLYKGNKVTFNFGSQNHSVTVNSIGTNSANISVASNPQDKVLVVGESWEVDLDEDNSKDIKVTLNNITSYTNVGLSVIELSSKKPTMEVNLSLGNKSEVSNLSNVNSSIVKEDKNWVNKAIILLVVIFVIVLIIVLVVLFWK